MSHTSKIFEEVPIKVQNKNGFDLSHLNCGTSKCGQLVPVMCKLLPPNSDFTLGISMNVELPPLATQFLGRVDAIVESFVVPLSMLYGGWKVFVSGQESTMFPASQSSVEGSVSRGTALDGETVMTTGGYGVPYFDVSAVSNTDIASFTTLMGRNENIYEYLGLRWTASPGGTGNPYYLNLLSGLAYHLIWDVYYRNKQVTKTIFAVNPNVGIRGGATITLSATEQAPYALNSKNVSLVWHSFYSVALPGSTTDPNLDTLSPYFSTAGQLTFPDGSSFFSTRQRNYSRDYFTASMPSPQQGSPSALVFDTSGATGQFTISALRAANSLQRFLEVNSLSGDFAEMIRNRWGVRPIDADFDEPYYLGRVVLPVYQKSVYQTGSRSDSASDPFGGDSRNPYVSGGLIGAKAASGSFVGEGSVCDKFHNTTWSYVMSIFSLVPHAAYGYGLNRELMFRELGDFPAPELQAIGNEAIKACELYFSPAFADTDFAYTSRFSRFKYMDDEIHGELRPGKTLDSFVLQRRLSYSSAGDRVLDTAFLEIPQNALDSVFAVSTDEMKLSCWYEIYFKFKVSMPLADYAIPTLGEIGDTHTIKTTQGGSRL